MTALAMDLGRWVALAAAGYGAVRLWAWWLRRKEMDWTTPRTVWAIIHKDYPMCHDSTVFETKALAEEYAGNDDLAICDDYGRMVFEHPDEVKVMECVLLPIK